MTGNRGRSLELFFIDGRPDGMLTATVPFQWTGHVLKSSRNQLSTALGRKEAKRTGVYLLIGEDEEGPLIYVGESEDISERIKQHDAKKEWWTDVIMITSNDDDLNKAHVKYLESRLVEILIDVKKINRENKNIPPRPSLSEAAKANMEGFLDNILMVLPALRIDYFLKNTRVEKTTNTTTTPAIEILKVSPVFELINKKHSIRAEAYLKDGDFVVRAGSKTRSKWEGKSSEKSHYWKLFDELVQQGVLIEKGKHCIFNESYAFSSPSAAGAVVNGRSTNGPKEWKVVNGTKTYREYEESLLERNPEDSI